MHVDAFNRHLAGDASNLTIGNYVQLLADALFRGNPVACEHGAGILAAIAKHAPEGYENAFDFVKVYSNPVRHVTGRIPRGMKREEKKTIEDVKMKKEALSPMRNESASRP